MRQTSHNTAFGTACFTSKPGGNDRIVKRALSQISGRSNARVLDLGCGTGALAIAIARARPDISVNALDISPANAIKVIEDAAAAGVGDQVTAICADYLTTTLSQYDLIVSDSVLQFIEGSNDALAVSLAADLVPDGTIVAAMPIESTWNRFRITLRYLWRLMPAVADRFIFALARKVYPDMPPTALADRISYLRILPVRLFGPAMKVAFIKAGLMVTDIEPWPNESAAKLQHVLIVWKRWR